ncbi:hypothetical protein PENTCL1PPCAC_19529, partial [Pristionchus entomophagus]
VRYAEHADDHAAHDQVAHQRGESAHQHIVRILRGYGRDEDTVGRESREEVAVGPEGGQFGPPGYGVSIEGRVVEQGDGDCGHDLSDGEQREMVDGRGQDERQNEDPLERDQ